MEELRENRLTIGGFTAPEVSHSSEQATRENTPKNTLCPRWNSRPPGA